MIWVTLGALFLLYNLWVGWPPTYRFYDREMIDNITYVVKKKRFYDREMIGNITYVVKKKKI